MPTPLYDTLTGLMKTSPLRMHMPGHKGRYPLVPGFETIAGLDFTEITGTGNLYEPGGPIDEAQMLWAQALGFSWCQFLTGGSTQGIHTALSLCCPPGSKILVDRGSHRSVFHSMALLDLIPVYLPRPWLAQDSVMGTIAPETVDHFLKSHPNIKMVCITSPTYYGLLSDIPGIARVVHNHGGTLVVDGAHGLHLPFMGLEVFEGADLVVASAHKTLPALGQGAVLLGRTQDDGRRRHMAAIYGSSSPSYPIMASLDLAREWMLGEGKAAYLTAAQRVQALREVFPGLIAKEPIDPLRLTIHFMDGFGSGAALEELGIYPELCDSGHVVMIVTGQDGEEALQRLRQGLERLRPQLGNRGELPPPPVPQAVLSQRQALFSDHQLLALRDCEGRIAGEQIAPYPPGIPVVAPGERITKKELAYFCEIGYTVQEKVAVCRV